MGPNLYTQTPGAIHMGGGYSNPFQAYDPFLSNVYGTTNRGDSFGRFGASLPGHALTAGMIANIASSFGLGGAVTRGVGQTLGLGALNFGPQIVATAALQYGASQISRGQEQNRIARDLSRRVFGERDVGGRMGLGASRSAMAGFSSAFRELANSSEMLTNDEELKNVLNKFSDMKLLETSKNMGEMATRVKKMSKTLREISMDLGTTLEGALPQVQRHAQMGFIDMDAMRQSIKTNRALRGVGISMQDATIQSFELAQASTNFAMGGDKRVGALGAQRTLGNMSVAASMGLLSDEDLMAATGKRGEEAVADLAQQSMQASSAFMQSDYGRMVAAALGEVKGGRFTGGIDANVKRRLKSLSENDIQEIADRKMAEGGASSFHRQMQSGMGANMGASLDMSEFTSVLDKVFDNENDMFNVIQQLTRMRGQTLDVLLNIQKDGERIVDETRRRSRELEVRNRLNSIVQQRFTIGGRLNTAYRDYLAEPIGKPLQEMGSDIGTSFGNYTDNFGTQILKRGIFSGTYRGLLGRGIGEDLGEQSFADRTQDLRSSGDIIFGEGAGMTKNVVGVSDIAGSLATMSAGVLMSNPYLAVAGGASLINDLSEDTTETVIGDGKERMARLLAASSELQEREYEGARGVTTFGISDSGFTDAYTGRREDVKLSKEQKEVLLHALYEANKKDDLEDLTEVYAQTAFDFAGAFSGTAGHDARDMMEARGGVYGTAKQLAQDKSLSASERRIAQKTVDRAETALREKVTLDSEDKVIKEQDKLNVALSGFFEQGTDGIETDYLGMGDELRQFEDSFFSGMLAEKEYHKLYQFMQGLSDDEVLSKLGTDDRWHADMTAEDAIGLAKDVFGVALSDGEGQSAVGMFKMLLDKKVADGSIGEFGRNIKSGTTYAANKLRRKIQVDANMRHLALARELDSSKIDDASKQALITSFGETTRGGQAGVIGAAKMFDLAKGLSKEDAGNVRGEMGRAVGKIRAIGDSRAELTTSIKASYGDKFTDQNLQSMEMDELKSLAVQASLMTVTPATKSTTAGKAIAQIDPEESSRIMLALSDNVAKNFEVITSSQIRHTKAITESVKRLERRVGGPQ